MPSIVLRDSVSLGLCNPSARQIACFQSLPILCPVSCASTSATPNRQSTRRDTYHSGTGHNSEFLGW